MVGMTSKKETQKLVMRFLRIESFLINKQMNEVTFVTSFFNIRRKENNEYQNDMENKHFVNAQEYLDKSKELLSRPFNFVIFTEPEYAPIFQEIRKNYPYKTRIIVYNFEELPMWHLVDKIIENSKKRPVRNLDSIKFTPLYSYIINLKTVFMKMTLMMNPFDSKWFAWSDIRGLSVSPFPLKEFRELVHYWNPSGINICMMSYANERLLADREYFYSYTFGKVAAGFFSANSDKMLEFCNECMQEWTNAVHDGYCPTDEMVYTHVIIRNRKLFTPYCGDYEDIFSNQMEIRRNAHIATGILYAAERDTNYHIMTIIGEHIRDGYMKGYLNDLENYDKVHLFFKLYVAYYWLGNRELAKERIREMLTEARNHPELQKIFYDYFDYLRPNIVYVYDDELIQKFEALSGKFNDDDE